VLLHGISKLHQCLGSLLMGGCLLAAPAYGAYFPSGTAAGKGVTLLLCGSQPKTAARSTDRTWHQTAVAIQSTNLLRALRVSLFVFASGKAAC
jgi:hypothetical protein